MITVKQGDTHNISFAVNMDLTGSTQRLLAREQSNAEPIELSIASVDEEAGTVTHQLTGTLAPVRYFVELEVTKAGVIATAPTDGYEVLRVVRDID